MWNGVPLPQDPGPIGMPGCSLLLAPEVMVLGAVSGGRVAWTIQVPASPALLGVTALLQGLVLDPPANVVGLTVSNALRARIGRV